MQVVRRWDLGCVAPVPIARPGRAREVLVARVVSPYEVGAPPVNLSGRWSCTVFGLDPRCKLVVVPFFRRAPWWAELAAAGIYDPGAVLTGADGEGYNVKVARVVVLRRDSSGLVHDVGELPADVWLNGGTIPDGCEIVTGADGVRVELEFGFPTAAQAYLVPAWDVVCAIELAPNERLGCSGLADEIVGSLEVRIDPPAVLVSNWGGEE